MSFPPLMVVHQHLLMNKGAESDQCNQQHSSQPGSQMDSARKVFDNLPDPVEPAVIHPHHRDVNDVHDRNKIMVWDFVTGTTRCEPSSAENNVQAGFTTEDYISFNKDTIIIDGVPVSVDIHVSMQEVLLHSGPTCGISLYGSDVNTRVPGTPTIGTPTTGVDNGGHGRRKRKSGERASGSYTLQVFASGDIVDTTGVISYASQCQPVRRTGRTNVTDLAPRAAENGIFICRDTLHQSIHVSADTGAPQEQERIRKTRRTKGTRRGRQECVQTNPMQGGHSGSRRTSSCNVM